MPRFIAFCATTQRKAATTQNCHSFWKYVLLNPVSLVMNVECALRPTFQWAWWVWTHAWLFQTSSPSSFHPGWLYNTTLRHLFRPFVRYSIKSPYNLLADRDAVLPHLSSCVLQTYSNISSGSSKICYHATQVITISSFPSSSFAWARPPGSLPLYARLWPGNYASVIFGPNRHLRIGMCRNAAQFGLRTVTPNSMNYIGAFCRAYNSCTLSVFFYSEARTISSPVHYIPSLP